MWHLGIWFCGEHGGTGLMLDLMILEAFSTLSDSVVPASTSAMTMEKAAQEEGRTRRYSGLS